MDYQALNFWLHAIELIGIIVIAVFQFFGGRSRVTAQAIARLRNHIDSGITKVEADMEQRDQRNVARITAVEGDVQRIEGEQKHAPGHDDLSNIHKRIDDVGAHVANIDGTLGAMGRTLDVIHQFLLNGANR